MSWRYSRYWLDTALAPSRAVPILPSMCTLGGIERSGSKITWRGDGSWKTLRKSEFSLRLRDQEIADRQMDEDQHHNFESWINWIHRTTKEVAPYILLSTPIASVH